MQNQKLALDLNALEVDTFQLVNAYQLPTYDTYWCTAASSEGPYACKATDALGC